MDTNPVETGLFAAGRPLRQLWQVPVFFLGLVALVGVCVARPPWRPVDAERARRELASARRVLEQPAAGRDQVQAAVEALEDHLPHLADQAAEAHFLLGSGYLRLAGPGVAPESREAAGKARRHLEQAQGLGVRDDDQPRLAFRLARAWYLTGGDSRTVIDYLARLIDRGATSTEEQFEGYGVLAQSYLRLPTPDLANALRAVEKQLQLPYDRDEQLAPVRLLCGELLLRLGRPEDARHALAHVGNNAPADVLARARFLRGRSLQQEHRWDDAAAVWKEILDDPRTAPREPGWTLYYLGVCQQQLDQREGAARAWAACAARADAGEEGVAAALGLAELRLLDDLPAALEAFERAVRDVKGPTDWKNSLADLEQVRALFERGCAVYREAGDIERSAQLVRLYEKLAPPGAAAFLRGRAAEAGARAKQGDEATALFLQAAEAYEQASLQATSPTEARDRLWLSADCYRRGGGPSRAIAALRQFLLTGEDRQQLSEGWFRLAEIQREQKDLTAARTAYLKCIEFMDVSPFAFLARYQLALIALANGDPERAEQELEHNLNQLITAKNPDLDPPEHTQAKRQAEERSLYMLANLLFQKAQRGDYQPAITRLEQALRTYPDSPDALRGRFLLAECHRRLAEYYCDLLKQHEPKSEENRQYHDRAYRRHLGLAADNYQQLIADLKEHPPPAQAPDHPYFRPAVFRAAEARFFLGQYEEAIPYYEMLAARDAGRVGELFALRGIVACHQYRRLQILGDTSLKPAVREEGTARELKRFRDALERFRTALIAVDDKAFEGEASTRAEYERMLRGWEDWLAETKK